MLHLFSRLWLLNYFVASYSVQYNLVSKKTALKFLCRNNPLLWKKKNPGYGDVLISQFVSHLSYHDKILVKLGDSLPTLRNLTCTHRKYAIFRREPKICVYFQACVTSSMGELWNLILPWASAGWACGQLLPAALCQAWDFSLSFV